MGRTNLTPHFTIEEAEYSAKAAELGLDNTLPSIYYGNATNLAMFVLEPIRLHFGKPFSPTSWYRSARLNEAVGGSEKSDHMIAAAADIKVRGVSLIALAEYIRDNLFYDQVILEPQGDGGWVHVSYKKDNNRMQVLTKTPDDYIEGLKI